MNERINGLWWKARIGYNNQNCDPEVLEKFAQLIVHECAACCGSQADKNNLLRHFGIPVESNVQYDAPPVHNSVTSQYTRKYNIP